MLIFTKEYKREIHSWCKAILQEKVNLANESMAFVLQSGESEQKSTAGDKHETTRSMMQLEQERAAAQIEKVNALVADFTQIISDKEHVSAGLGALVETTQGVFFLSVALGKIPDKNVFCLSSVSPLGTVLMGKKKGDKFSFNGNEVVVKQVF